MKKEYDFSNHPLFKETRKSEKEVKELLTALDAEVISPVVKDSISDIKEKFDDEKVKRYLDEVQEDILAKFGVPINVAEGIMASRIIVLETPT